MFLDCLNKQLLMLVLMVNTLHMVLLYTDDIQLYTAVDPDEYHPFYQLMIDG